HDPAAAEGYQGGDEFCHCRERARPEIPAVPGGGTNREYRQLQYVLVPGEAGWLLQLDRIVEY
ncbi:MAG: hypothetical protein OEV30_05840, partial [Ignavibacteria bacterium]|nr:hypothetical protein [Ignavibacteria bacterium]